MEIVIRKIGNSRGVVLPKPLLAQAGLDSADAASVSVEDGAIVLRRLPNAARSGWAEAARAVAEHEGDALLLGEFGNSEDEEFTW